MRTVRNISIFLILFALVGCAEFMRADLSPLEQAKINANVYTEQYFHLYANISEMMESPVINEETKNILRVKVNPIMNKLKRALIAYTELIQDVENGEITFDNSVVSTKEKEILSCLEMINRILYTIQGRA